MLVLNYLVINLNDWYDKEYNMADFTDYLKDTEQSSVVKIPDNRNHKESSYNMSGMPSPKHIN